MSDHRARNLAALAAALASTATALAPPALAASGGERYGPPRVTRDADVQTEVAVYDPRDRLGLPGDTHTLSLYYVAAHPQALSLVIGSVTCGDDDPSRPPYDLGCEPAAAPQYTVWDARADVLSDTRVRVRSTTTAGRLDLTLTGARQPEAGEPFVSREWRRDIGTVREHERTVAIDSSQATIDRGTFGGIALFQSPDWLLWSNVRTRTTTARTGTGPAVAVPALPPPGTQDGGWRTYGRAEASWRRDLPVGGPAGTRDVELGDVSYYAGDEYGDYVGSGHAGSQRCERGERPVPWNGYPPRRPCEVLQPFRNGSDNSTAALDVPAGTVRLALDLFDVSHQGADRVVFRWRGTDPVGFRSVEVTKFEAIAGARRFTEEGVRWRHVTATGTIAGDPADSVTGEDFTVYRRKEEFNFTP